MSRWNVGDLCIFPNILTQLGDHFGGLVIKPQKNSAPADGETSVRFILPKFQVVNIPTNLLRPLTFGYRSTQRITALRSILLTKIIASYNDIRAEEREMLIDEFLQSGCFGPKDLVSMESLDKKLQYRETIFKIKKEFQIAYTMNNSVDFMNHDYKSTNEELEENAHCSNRAVSNIQIPVSHQSESESEDELRVKILAVTDTYSEKVKHLQKEIKELKEKLENKTKKVEEIDAKITEIEDLKKKLSENLVKMKSDEKDLKSREDHIKDLTAKMKTIENDAKKKEATIVKLRQTQKESNDLKEKIKEYAQKLETDEKALLDKNDTIKQLEAKIETLENDSEQKGNEIVRLKVQKVELESDVGDLKQEILELKSIYGGVAQMTAYERKKIYKQINSKKDSSEDPIGSTSNNSSILTQTPQQSPKRVKLSDDWSFC